MTESAPEQDINPKTGTVEHGDEPWVSPEILAVMRGERVVVETDVTVPVEQQPEAEWVAPAGTTTEDLASSSDENDDKD